MMNKKSKIREKLKRNKITVKNEIGGVGSIVFSWSFHNDVKLNKKLRSRFHKAFKQTKHGSISVFIDHELIILDIRMLHVLDTKVK